MQILALIAMMAQMFAIGMAAPIYGNPGADANLSASQIASRSASENYIVIFENSAGTPDSVFSDLENSMRNLGISVNYVYHSVIKGFSISLAPELMSSLKALNNDSYPFILELDKKVHTA